jgi:GNAT superfamily N-acetyltransferase
MTVRIETLSPEHAIEAYNCQPDTPELTKFKKQSAEFLGDKIRSEKWIAYALYDENKPAGKAILIPTNSGMTWIEGEGVYFFHCMNLQKPYRQKGWGRQFLTRIIDDMSKLDVRALAVTCFAEYWMSFSFFKHMGFEEVMNNNLASLMVKRFDPDTQIFLSPKKPEFDIMDDNVRVDIVYDMSCPFMTSNYANHKIIAESFSPKIQVFEHYIRMACDYSAVGDAGFYIEGEDITAGPVDEFLLKRKLREHLQKKGFES